MPLYDTVCPLILVIRYAELNKLLLLNIKELREKIVTAHSLIKKEKLALQTEFFKRVEQRNNLKKNMLQQNRASRDAHQRDADDIFKKTQKLTQSEYKKAQEKRIAVRAAAADEYQKKETIISYENELAAQKDQAEYNLKLSEIEHCYSNQFVMFHEIIQRVANDLSKANENYQCALDNIEKKYRDDMQKLNKDKLYGYDCSFEPPVVPLKTKTLYVEFCYVSLFVDTRTNHVERSLDKMVCTVLSSCGKILSEDYDPFLLFECKSIKPEERLDAMKRTIQEYAHLFVQNIYEKNSVGAKACGNDGFVAQSVHEYQMASERLFQTKKQACLAASKRYEEQCFAINRTVCTMLCSLMPLCSSYSDKSIPVRNGEAFRFYTIPRDIAKEQAFHQDALGLASELDALVRDIRYN